MVIPWLLDMYKFSSLMQCFLFFSYSVLRQAPCNIFLFLGMYHHGIHVHKQEGNSMNVCAYAIVMVITVVLPCYYHLMIP